MRKFSMEIARTLGPKLLMLASVSLWCQIIWAADKCSLLSVVCASSTRTTG